jgi:hypothetical protein
VLELVIYIALGVAITIAWMIVWAAALRAFGIPALTPTTEGRAIRRQRILQMGKVRYVLIFGVLGSGVGLGLGMVTAIVMTDHPPHWGKSVAIFGTASLVIGLLNSVRTWNENYRDEVPFPPHYSASK